MWTATRLNCFDPPGFQRVVTDQELAILFREDIVGDRAQIDFVAQRTASAASIAAVLPLPTGPPTPTVKARLE